MMNSSDHGDMQFQILPSFFPLCNLEEKFDLGSLYSGPARAGNRLFQHSSNDKFDRI